jgi:predicted nucleotidyltransferase
MVQAARFLGGAVDDGCWGLGDGQQGVTMAANRLELLPVVTAWLTREKAVKAAILFGSSARPAGALEAVDHWSDVDLHVVTTAAARLERLDWSRELAGLGFCHQTVRPATGGVRKVTALFGEGEIDLVLVPAARLRLYRLAVRLGLYRKNAAMRYALNEIATCLRSGYRFLKGEDSWGDFYAWIAAEMPGTRLDDRAAAGLADVFLCDLLWVLQKLERGELVAAQHLLHRSLAETNFRLMREWRLRRGLPLPSFGLGRRAESLYAPEDLRLVQIDARLDAGELHQAAWQAFDGVTGIMHAMVPDWRIPTGMHRLLGGRDQAIRR